METATAYDAGPPPNLIVVFALDDAELDMLSGDSFWYRYFERLAAEGVLTEASWHEADRRIRRVRRETALVERHPPIVDRPVRRPGDSATRRRGYGRANA